MDSGLRPVLGDAEICSSEQTVSKAPSHGMQYFLEFFLPAFRSPSSSSCSSQLEMASRNYDYFKVASSHIAASGFGFRNTNSILVKRHNQELQSAAGEDAHRPGLLVISICFHWVQLISIFQTMPIGHYESVFHSQRKFAKNASWTRETKSLPISKRKK